MDWLQEHRIIHSWLGLIHTVFALASMIFGAVVLIKPKGDKKHMQLGYLYVWSMILMNLTAFGIYNFGCFSLFHGFAVFSLITLAAGIYPTIKKSKGWYPRHFYFMSCSVVGLFFTLVDDVAIRLLL